MRRLISAIFASVVAMGMIANCCEAAPLPPEKEQEILSKDALATVTKLTLLSEKEFGLPPNLSWDKRRAELTEAHAEFLIILKILDGQVDDETAELLIKSNSDNLNRNLVELAKDYVANPHKFEQVINFYATLSEAALQFRVLHPNTLNKKHTSAEYRSTWEFILLAPPTTASDFIRPRCFEALTAIRDDASIPLLIHLFKRANTSIKEGRYEFHADTEQSRVLGVLAHYRNEAALRALLLCLEAAETVPRTDSISSGPELRKKVSGFLRYESSTVSADRWRKVIEQTLEGKLSDVDRAFLTSVLKASNSK